MRVVEVCSGCGSSYASFRTGLRFRDVRASMCSGSADPSTWRHKRRRSVLGYWHELKRMLWSVHLGECEAGVETE